MRDDIAVSGLGEYFVSWDVRLGSAIAAGKSLALLSMLGDGGSGAYLSLLNVTGTNTWQFDSWRGSGDFNSRQHYLITGMTLPVGAYTRLKVAVLSDQFRGRIRLWQDGVLLVDINITPTVTNTVADRMWRPFLGMTASTQRLQTLAVDNILFSRGADAT